MDNKQTLEEMDAITFCDLQGASDIDRAVICKKYADETMSYEEWHTLTSPEFQIGGLRSWDEE